MMAFKLNKIVLAPQKENISSVHSCKYCVLAQVLKKRNCQVYNVLITPIIVSKKLTIYKARIKYR